MNNLTILHLQQLKDNWFWYFILGISLVILGTLAITFSFVSTLFSVLYLGFFLIILGLFEGVQALKLHRLSRFFLHIFLSILYCASGLYIVLYPELNAVNLTLLLALFFIVSGILKIIFSLRSQATHNTWFIINGLITLLLGILIWQQWPVSGFWVIGMFVGIDTLFTGWNWIMLALFAKNIQVDNHTH